MLLLLNTNEGVDCLEVSLLRSQQETPPKHSIRGVTYYLGRWLILVGKQKKKPCFSKAISTK